MRVISARENISDDASGILVEGVLESMAEYYSAELSQKIRRGMEINAQKCLANGSNPGLGYKVDSERRYYVDEEEAKIVREIFERYASGETVADIIRDLNRRKLTTFLGKPFNKNSVHRILNNRRYIGYYLYKGQETPGGMPRIIEDELFERVHHILDRNKKAPARARGREEYLLTTKLFCGYCREMMTGYGGTGKSGKTYLYSLRQGDKNDENIKRGIINIFLRAVYLYDDRFTLVLNGSDTPITIDDILLDEIEEGLEGDLTSCEGCSSLVADAPPKEMDMTFRRVHFFWRWSFFSIPHPHKTAVPGVIPGTAVV